MVSRVAEELWGKIKQRKVDEECWLERVTSHRVVREGSSEKMVLEQGDQNKVRL